MPRRAARMIGGSLSCPPGFHCMDTSTVLTYIFIGITIVAFGVFLAKQNGWLAAAAPLPQQPHVVIVEKNVQPPAMIHADPRFAPLSPEQAYSPPADIRGFPSPPIAAGSGAVPINIATRGYPDSYQQIGVLTAPGGTATSASPTRTILPLFGRKLATNRDRWNYYTRTDGMNPVQVPVQFKRRNCDDDLGCDEIMDGDSIGVPILGNSFTANVYRYSTPRYLPSL